MWLTVKSDLHSSIAELESLGLEKPQLNEFNDSYEVGNLVDNLKQMLFVEYKSMPIFTDWRMEPDKVEQKKAKYKAKSNTLDVWTQQKVCKPQRED